VQVIPFLGRHLAHYNDPSGTDATYFMHDTKLGSTAQVTDYSGAMAQDLLYYPWGGEWSMSGTYQEMRFARLQHRDETETGLNHRHFRMFSSTEGRWMSTDPATGCVRDPQVLDGYAYVRNSPANYTDPQGDLFSPCLQCYDAFTQCEANAEADYRTGIGEVHSFFESCSQGCEAACSIFIFFPFGYAPIEDFPVRECQEECNSLCLGVAFSAVAVCDLYRGLEDTGCLEQYKVCQVLHHCGGAQTGTSAASLPVLAQFPYTSSTRYASLGLYVQ
jgi:RHS repeat-associated protein